MHKRILVVTDCDETQIRCGTFYNKIESVRDSVVDVSIDGIMFSAFQYTFVFNQQPYTVYVSSDQRVFHKIKSKEFCYKGNTSFDTIYLIGDFPTLSSTAQVVFLNLKEIFEKYVKMLGNYPILPSEWCIRAVERLSLQSNKKMDAVLLGYEIGFTREQIEKGAIRLLLKWMGNDCIEFIDDTVELKNENKQDFGRTDLKSMFSFGNVSSKTPIFHLKPCVKLDEIGIKRGFDDDYHLRDFISKEINDTVWNILFLMPFIEKPIFK
jgi:hypothetical protein